MIFFLLLVNLGIFMLILSTQLVFLIVELIYHALKGGNVGEILDRRLKRICNTDYQAIGSLIILAFVLFVLCFV